MIKVGITGGIGSGKTTVCKIIESMGYPVYYADVRAKALMTGNKVVKKKIIDLFGKDAYFSNGRLNRKVISAIVFNDKSMLELLNKIVHPAVKEDGENWFANLSSTLAFKEAALLVESNSYKELDYLIVVTCPIELRIERVMKRDKVSRDKVLARMKNQISEEEKISYADFVIVNDGNEDVSKQIKTILDKIKKP